VYISSHKPRRKSWSCDPSALGHREHAALEFDVTFGRTCGVNRIARAANLAAVRRLALSLLRQDKTNQRGLKNKTARLRSRSRLPA